MPTSKCRLLRDDCDIRRCFCWLYPVQQQSRQRDYRTEKREPVAVTSVERGVLFQRVAALQRRALVAWNLVHDAAVRIDDSGDAAVGVAQQPTVIFDGAHASHVEVLPRCTALAIPSVVGDVHEKLSAIGGQVADLIGKDRFVADEYARL